MSREKVIVTFALTLIAIVSVAIVFGGIYFSLVGFFSIVGVTYESTGSLLLFIFYCLLIGVVFELFEVIILFYLEKANPYKRMSFIWKAFLSLGLTWIVIHIVNELMTTITLSLLAEFLTAILIVSVDIVFDDEKKSA